MIQAANDQLSLEHLNPLDVAAFLRVRGWRPAESWGDKASVWLHGEGNAVRDVLLPSRRSFADYALRLRQILETLSQVENRDTNQILRELENTTHDLVRVRALGVEAIRGSLALPAALELVERSRDLLLSAACSVWDRRPSFSNRKPQEAIDYLSTVRMGQTERGSFILTFLSPTPPNLQAASPQTAEEDTLVTGIEEPFARRTTALLMESLVALNRAAQSAALTGTAEAFQQAVQQGVSANLCDAVAGLAETSPTEGIEISTSWATARPFRSDIPSQVLISPDTVPYLREAARQLRDRTPVEDVLLEGFIIRLDRPIAQDDGEATLLAQLEGRNRRVLLTLAGEDYNAATRAHAAGLEVSCTGVLTQEGRSLRLIDPRRFIVRDNRPL